MPAGLFLRVTRMSDDIQFQLLQSMDKKLDAMNSGMAKLGERVAVVEKVSEECEAHSSKLDDHARQIGDLRNKVAPIYAGIATFISAIVSVAVGYFTGFFKGDI